MLRAVSLLCACWVLACGGEAAAPQDRHRGARPPARDEAAASASVSLVVVAELRGVLEPCGCGGRPSGGLDRIAGMVRRWRGTGQPTLLLTAGDLLIDPNAADTAQAELEREALLALLGRLKPDAIAAGEADLREAASSIASLARASGAKLLAPRVAALDGLSVSTTALLETPSVVVGVVRASGRSPHETARAIAELRARGAHAIIAAAGASDPRPPALLDTVDVLLVLGSPGESSRREDRVLIVDPGEHGEALWRIELARGNEGVTARAERHLLDAGSPSEVDARRLLKQTFARINALNASRAHGSGVAPAPGTARAFVGSRTCAACHASEYLWWQATPHARAYASLRARGRELDLDCIGCHVTGFDEPLGASIGRLDELAAVGCESCHGAGGRHADNPGDRLGAVQRAVSEPGCMRCHDAAHSPHFEYAAFRRRRLAPGHGGAGSQAP